LLGKKESKKEWHLVAVTQRRKKFTRMKRLGQHTQWGGAEGLTDDSEWL
jgi:hypothetical protein